MKTYILDSLFEEIETANAESCLIYGLRTPKKIVLCTLSDKPEFELVGHFDENAAEQDSHTEKDAVILAKDSDGKFSCFVTAGDDDEKSKTNLLKIDHQVIHYKTDFNKRNHGIIDESSLQSRKVTIIGLGSGGATTAEQLLRSGVTNLTLIDFDTVSLSNLCRSIYTLEDLDCKKTDALKRKLLRINPLSNIETIEDDILSMPISKLSEILDSTDLLIEATDSMKTKILVNGLAHNKVPVIYPAVYDKGKGGDILFTYPGSPCYECAFSQIMRQTKDREKGDWDYSTNSAKPMPALIADIQVIVSRSVKLALAILSADSEKSFIEDITEKDCTLLFIGNEKGVFIFDSPFQEVWAKVEIDPDCMCQQLQ